MEGIPFSEQIERILAGWAAQLARMRFDREPEPYHPTSQRDVGKTAVEASGVEAIIHDIQRYRQPDVGVGYTDAPDPPDDAA